MRMLRSLVFGPTGSISIGKKFTQINWSLIFLISLVSSIGFATLYSAAGGNIEPWAMRQMTRFAIGMLMLICIALIDLRFWFKVAYPFYGFALLLLVAVEIAGDIGMGAQRWLDLGFIQLQPSELMKVALVLVLARYFHGLSYEEIGQPTRLVWPALLVLVPAALVAKQPDLGSAILLGLTGAVIFLAAGVRIWKFILVGGAAAAVVPVAWRFLREYQRQRVLTFLNPENDPLGAGYHIIQSRIALGSGGIWGKGYLQGTQAYLQFLPERQTDFIFPMFAEEFGLAGALILIGLYALIIVYGLAIALRAQTQFGRLTAVGLIGIFFIYAFVNMAMVQGLMPVVGIPLPFMSYGGTAMMSLLISFGILISVYVHRDVRVGRRAIDDD